MFSTNFNNVCNLLIPIIGSETSLNLRVRRFNFNNVKDDNDNNYNDDNNNNNNDNNNLNNKGVMHGDISSMWVCGCVCLCVGLSALDLSNGATYEYAI